MVKMAVMEAEQRRLMLTYKAPEIVNFALFGGNVGT